MYRSEKEIDLVKHFIYLIFLRRSKCESSASVASAFFVVDAPILSHHLSERVQDDSESADNESWSVQTLLNVQGTPHISYSWWSKLVIVPCDYVNAVWKFWLCQMERFFY